MEDDNDILIENDIVKAISFNGSISGTTDFLVDAANLFEKRYLKKKRLKTRTGAQGTHESCWQKDSMVVTKSSNVSVPEIIPLTKLQKYANNYIFVNVVSIIDSVKSALCMKEGGDKEPAVTPIDNIPKKWMLFSSTTKSWNYTKQYWKITEFETAPCPQDNFHSNWAQYTGNTQFDLKHEITIDLQMLYKRGKWKKGRITSDKACDILYETLIQYDWEQQMILSVPNINSSSLRPHKNGRDNVKKKDIDGSIEEEENVEDYSLKYIWLLMVTIKYNLQW